MSDYEKIFLSVIFFVILALQCYILFERSVETSEARTWRNALTSLIEENEFQKEEIEKLRQIVSRPRIMSTRETLLIVTNLSQQELALQHTIQIRTILLDIIQRYKIKSFFDTACNEMLWMPSLLEEIDDKVAGFHYLGSNQDRGLITSHRKRFASHPNWKFQVFDPYFYSLPDGYDVIFNRDGLQDISYPGIFTFLDNVKDSDAKYLLVGSYLNATETSVRTLFNLFQPPYNLGSPLEIFLDVRGNTSEFNRYLIFYDIEKLREQDD